jgi:hypothetical protein
MPPDARQSTDPKTAFEDMKKNSPEASSVEMVTQPIKALFKTLLEDRHKIRFVELEQSGFDRLTPYAFAVVELIPPDTHDESADHDHDHDHAHEPEYAMLELRGSQSGKLDWMIQEITYPYTRNSATVKAAPVDDGHGHSH